MNCAKALAGAACLLAFTSPAAAQSSTPVGILEATPADVELLAALRAGTATVQNLTIVNAASTVEVDIQLGGVMHQLSVVPHSVRSADFQLLVQEANGELVPHTPEPSLTYRGSVKGYAGSKVGLSIIDGQLHGVVRMGASGPVYGFQPADQLVSDAPEFMHVVYDADTISIEGATCTALPNPSPTTHEGATGGLAGTEFYDLTQIGCDADFQFFQDNGSDVAATEAKVELLVNGASAIYEDDQKVQLEITAIIVRASEPDPYTTTNSDILLPQLRSEWLNNQGGITYDIAHLFTGKNLDGSTIGLAYVDVVCSSFRFGLTETNFSPSIASQTAVLSHEVGHNFGAGHCDGTANCKIMCSGIGGCGPITSFGPSATGNIQSSIPSFGCLSVGDPIPGSDKPFLGLITPSTIPSVIPGNTQSVSLTGSGLATVNQVNISGEALSAFPPAYTIVNDGLITIRVPLQDTLGFVPIEVVNIAGSVSSSINVVPADPPAIVLGSGSDPEQLFSFAPTVVTAGGEPGHIVYLTVSGQLVPSVLPGLIDLAIGNNFSNLFILSTDPQAANAWIQKTFNFSGLPFGLNLYFQVAEVDPVTIEITSSNVAHGSWVF